MQVPQARPGTEAPRDTRSLVDHAQRIQRDAAMLTREVRATGNLLEHMVTDQARRRPWSTIGGAAAVGYILGGGLRSRLTLVLLRSATRLVAALAARELGEFAMRVSRDELRPVPSVPSDRTSGA